MLTHIPSIEKIDSCLLRIANIVSLYIDDLPSNGLVDGKLGASIFFHQYANYSGEELYNDFAKELIEDVGNQLNTINSFDFANGLTGIGWGLKYLSKNGYEGLEEYLRTVGSRINAKILKEPILMKKQYDLYGHGLYYLAKGKRTNQENDELHEMMNREMLDSLYVDCERLLSKRMVIGKPVPKLRIYQLNSVLHFILHLQEVDSEKFNFILKYLPSYYGKLEDKSCDKVDFQVFNYLIKRLKERITDPDLRNKYRNLDSEIELSDIQEDGVHEFIKAGWYSILYREDYTERLDTIVDINTAFKIAHNRPYWEDFLLNLDNNKLGINQGLIGLGLVLLEVQNRERHERK